ADAVPPGRRAITNTAATALASSRLHRPGPRAGNGTLISVLLLGSRARTPTAGRRQQTGPPGWVYPARPAAIFARRGGESEYGSGGGKYAPARVRQRTRPPGRVGGPGFGLQAHAVARGAGAPPVPCRGAPRCPPPPGSPRWYPSPCTSRPRERPAWHAASGSSARRTTHAGGTGSSPRRRRRTAA